MTKNSLLAVTLMLLAGSATVHAQGSLIPPGPPGPTMKTLAQVEPRTPISTADITISVPGSYYLTTNLVGLAGKNGVTIAADNVQLDLSGFAVLGSAGSLNGIATVGTRRNITVSNGTVSGWPGTGVAILAQGGECKGLKVFNNGGSGISLDDHFLVSNCFVMSNASVGILGGDYSRFSDCYIASNNSSGISAFANNTVERCSLVFNGGNGFTASTDSRITDSTANRNKLNGFSIGSSGQVLNSTAIGNTNAGFLVGSESLVLNSVARGNTGNGFKTLAKGTFRSCTASANSANGFDVGTGSVVENCTADSNTPDGIYALNSNRIIDNRCYNNGSALTNGAGIRVAAGSNRIEGNTLTANKRGLVVDQINNQIVRNACQGNTVTNFSILSVPSQMMGPIISGGGYVTTENPWVNFEY